MVEQSNDISRDAAAKTTQLFESLWKVIKNTSTEHWILNVRDIGNLAGICLFPVGWTLEELTPPSTFYKVRPYEIKASKLRHIVVPSDLIQSEGGRQCCENGANFRIKKVNQLLLKMIYREEIKIDLDDESGNRRPLSDKTRLAPGVTVDVRGLCIRLDELALRWDFFTDAQRFHDALEPYRGWQPGRKDTYDLLRIERYLRNLFESQGLPSNKDAYLKDFYNWFHNPDAEPSPNTVRPIISRLFEEYSVT